MLRQRPSWRTVRRHEERSESSADLTSGELENQTVAAEFLSLRRWQGLEIISKLVSKKGAWGAWARHSFDASGGWRFWHDGPDRQGPRTTNADNAVDITNEPLFETQWLIQDRLETGIVYTWMVTALKDAQEIIAPASPARA